MSKDCGCPDEGCLASDFPRRLTNPPPPETLSEAEIDQLRVKHRLVLRSQQHAFAKEIYAAGYEARGKRDAEIARTEVPGDMCGDLIAAAIERTPEQPTTQTLYVCNADGCHYRTPDKSGAALHNQASGHALRIVHSQPTTGEACSCPSGDHLDGCYIVERR